MMLLMMLMIMMMMMMMIEQSLGGVSEVGDLLEKSLVENIHTGVQQSTFGWIALPSPNSQIASDGKVQRSTLIQRREALSPNWPQTQIYQKMHRNRDSKVFPASRAFKWVIAQKRVT